MGDGDTIRKLRAIMFSDIVGYSKMMQYNEAEALKLLQLHKDIVTEISEKHGAKVIKCVGDEILVESESAVLLVYCAKELQKYFHDRNATVPKSRELSVRIGIHIGDVVVKEEDIFGDGVNIASRIRPLSEPGGIVITHSVIILLGNQDDIRCSFIGNRKLKNITERIKIYRVLPDYAHDITDISLNKSSGINRKMFLKVILPASMTLLFIILTMYLLIRTSFSDYEEEYFRGNLQRASAITMRIESVKNVKANYFNIVSSDARNSVALKNYYSEMHRNNPENNKVKFYRALLNLHFPSGRSSIDSAFTDLKTLERLNIRNPYLMISQLKLYNTIGARGPSARLAQNILEMFPENPLVVFEAAETFRNVLNNLEKSQKLYRRTLSIFSDFSDAYNGLSDIEFKRGNFQKAVALSDSALMINPNHPRTIRTAVRNLKTISDFSRMYQILDALPPGSADKYFEMAKLALIENQPSQALHYIGEGLLQFPDRQDFVEAENTVKRIIAISDSIQRIENSIPSDLNKWADSWSEAARIARRENKPVIIVALDSESLSSKYLELALLDRSALRISNEAVMLRVLKHRDIELISEFGIRNFPSLIFVGPDKVVYKIFENRKDYLTDSDVVVSFITESVLLNRTIVSSLRDTEDNRYKAAKDLRHAEDLAIEFGLPIISILTSRNSERSDLFLRHTALNPGFMKNYNRTVLFPVENAESSALAFRHRINKFPSVVMFDEVGNMIFSRYGSMPQKILLEEINKVKFFRRRNEIIKEGVNWVYDIQEALSFSEKDNKPVLAYITTDVFGTFKPESEFFEDYEIIKKVNNGFIPLFVSRETNRTLYDRFTPDFLPSIAVLDRNGEIVYDSVLPGYIDALHSFLDYRVNTDLLVSLGSGKFSELLNKIELNKALVDNLMALSASQSLVRTITNFPTVSCAYSDIGDLNLQISHFGNAVYYLNLLKNKNFVITDRYLKLITTSSLLWHDFFRLENLLKNLADSRRTNRFSQSKIFACLAEIYLAEDMIPEAVEYAEKAIAADPGRFENHNLIGILNYKTNLRKAEDSFRSSLVIEPDNTVANAYLYEITGEKRYLTAAKRSYHSGNTDFIGLRYIDRSNEYTNRGLLDLIHAAFRTMLMIYPENKSFRLDFVRFLSESGEDLSTALETVNELLREEPENVEYMTAASWVLYSLGDFSGADRMITRAFGNLSPENYEDNPMMFYYLGMIKSSIGDVRSAKYFFERLINFTDKDGIGYQKIDYSRRFIQSVH